MPNQNFDSSQDKDAAKKWLINFVDWALKGMIVAIFGMLWNMNTAQREMAAKIDIQQNQINELKAETTIIRSQMVSWDVLTRIERTLGLLVATSKGNAAMAGVADVIKAEREARTGSK